MAKTSGGAGRYKGSRSVGGGLRLSANPTDAEKRRASASANAWHNEVRYSGTYDADRASLMKSAADSGYLGKVFVWDKAGNLQGAASYRNYGNTLYVGLLGSRGKGAGSQIMRELFEQVVRTGGDGLGLTALELARPFYYKMGLTTNWNFGGNMGITRAEIIQQLRRMK